MALPGTVYVGPLEYEIVLRDGLRDSDDTQLWGRCDHRALVIELDRSLSPRRMLTTLMHEILHAVAMSTSVELSEADTDRRAAGLTSALLRSGMLRRRLIRDD